MENHWGFVFCLRVTNLTLTSLSGAWLLIKLGEINLNKNDTIFTRDRWTQSEFTQVRLTHRKQLILTNLTQRHRNERGCCTLKGNRVPLHPSARGALMLRPRRTPGEHQPRAPKHRFLKLAVKNGPGAEERPPSLPTVGAGVPPYLVEGLNHLHQHPLLPGRHDASAFCDVIVMLRSGSSWNVKQFPSNPRSF